MTQIQVASLDEIQEINETEQNRIDEIKAKRKVIILKSMNAVIGVLSVCVVVLVVVR